jgi:hypothetical protein
MRSRLVAIGAGLALTTHLAMSGVVVMVCPYSGATLEPCPCPPQEQPKVPSIDGGECCKRLAVDAPPSSAMGRAAAMPRPIPPVVVLPRSSMAAPVATSSEEPCAVAQAPPIRRSRVFLELEQLLI